MMILNMPIECPNFAILTDIEGGGSNATSIDVYARIDTSGHSIIHLNSGVSPQLW